MVLVVSAANTADALLRRHDGSMHSSNGRPVFLTNLFKRRAGGSSRQQVSFILSSVFIACAFIICAEHLHQRGSSLTILSTIAGEDVPRVKHKESSHIDTLANAASSRRLEDLQHKESIQSDQPSKVDPSKRSRPWFYEYGKKMKPFKQDRYWKKKQMNLYASIPDLPIDEIMSNDTMWIMQDKITSPRRNHGCSIVKDGDTEILVNILGRYGRSVHRWDLKTGDQTEVVTEGLDPAGYPLNDLNHVSAVVVDTLDGKSKEIWMTCGFHGDLNKGEISSSYARVIDIADMKVRLGPKLPFPGGACAAMPIFVDGPGKPPHICSFGGSIDSHDSGKFVDKTMCYDRMKKKWLYPFGRLPKGMDHLNAAHVPAGTCSPSDPGRILVMNYRTEAYGKQHQEILAFDLPRGGWTREELDAMDASKKGAWYKYADNSLIDEKDRVNIGRDASGLVTAGGGRAILNFGGVHYRPRKSFHEIRLFDICQRRPAAEKKWTDGASMGLALFAVQTCSSSTLNVAITCGGTGKGVFLNRQGDVDADSSNSPWCIVNRFPNHLPLDDVHQTSDPTFGDDATAIKR